jgi:single-strand DNA-binding protein
MLIGRLGDDPVMRHTPEGTPVTNFSIATDRSWKDNNGATQEVTEWHNIVAWGKLAEITKTYLAKGNAVYVEGRLQTRKWQDKDQMTRYRTEVVAEQVKFLETKSKDLQRSQTTETEEIEGQVRPGLIEEDLPF